MATPSTRTELQPPQGQFKLFYSDGFQETITDQPFFSSLQDPSINPLVSKWGRSEYFSLKQRTHTVFVNSSKLLFLTCISDNRIAIPQGVEFKSELRVYFQGTPKVPLILQKDSRSDVCKRIEKMTQSDHFLIFSDDTYRTIIFPQKTAQRLSVIEKTRHVDLGKYFSIHGGYSDGII